MVMRYMSIADTRLFGLMCRSPKSERVFEFINLDQKLKVTACGEERFNVKTNKADARQ